MTPSTVYYDPSKYTLGTEVRVVSPTALETFRLEWKFHNKLQPEQMQYAGRIAKVAKSYMYHGGDVLYELDGLPGIWHEQCVEAV
jgi:hypothetical protein